MLSSLRSFCGDITVFLSAWTCPPLRNLRYFSPPRQFLLFLSGFLTSNTLPPPSSGFFSHRLTLLRLARPATRHASFSSCWAGWPVGCFNLLSPTSFSFTRRFFLFPASSSLPARSLRPPVCGPLSLVFLTRFAPHVYCYVSPFSHDRRWFPLWCIYTCHGTPYLLYGSSVAAFP